ncbi:unnamed protein product [Meloidogyne enterolobii]|uniref:Uncharacterized protein n=1 Tax=Meloidogyne enterolobii TaxID=390850 RepID=A0ACB0ZY81_MELEN
MPHSDNKMGRWGAVSYIVGNIVGSGIFIVPGSMLQNTGSVGLFLIVWLLSAAVATLGAYCYCELGTSIRRSGGDFAYLTHVRWNAIAFMFMSIGCVLIYPLMLAIQAETTAEYTVQAFRLNENCLNNPILLFIFKKLIFSLFALFMMFINFYSLRRVGARFQIAGTVAKLLATTLIVCTAIYILISKGQLQNFSSPFQNSKWEAMSLVNAFFAGLFSYDGWDVLNFGAEEIENPKRTMPFAILSGMFCVTSIYIVINLSFLVVLDADTVRDSTAVAMVFAQQSLGQFQHIMPFIIILVMMGAMNGTIFTASRYLFAAARSRQIPSFLALLNPENDSPRASIFTHVLMAILFSFVGDTNQLINYLGFAQWLQRGFTMCALLWIRFNFNNFILHPDAIKTPIFMPIIFLCVCLSLVGITIIQEFSVAKFGLLVLAIAFLIYFVFIWENTFLNRFPIFKEFCSLINGSFYKYLIKY